MEHSGTGAEVHRVELEIYSEVGQGTTIKIYLPRAGDIELTKGQIDKDRQLLTGDAREVILVVDDEPAVRQFSADALSELGYQVLEAGSAAVALRLLREHQEIVLLFTDIIMPETNGRKLEHFPIKLTDIRLQ